MTDKTTICKCPDPNFWWFCAVNEDGWKCTVCNGFFDGEPAGFSLSLDRENVREKCNSVLMELAEDYAGIVYVGSGADGDYLVETVAARCQTEGRYDQYSIALFYLQKMTPSHADYWQKISEGVLSGNDPRDRCDCGKLANSWRNNEKFCSEHCT